MSTASTTDRTVDVAKPRGRKTLWLWVGVLVAVIAVAGIAAWLVFSSGGEDPTLVFDGSTATYSGPDTFEAGEVTFTLENTTREMVRFGWNVTNDESVTLEEEIAWMETHRGSSYEIPPWVEEYGGIGQVAFMDDVQEASVELPEGKILLIVWNPGENVLHPAAHITVTSD